MKYIILLFFLVGIFWQNTAQSTITPEIIATTGNSARTNTLQLDWTVGELAVTPVQNAAIQVTQGFHQPRLVRVNIVARLDIKAFLQGAFDRNQRLMHDSLRVKGLIPLVEPYSELSNFEHNGISAQILPSILEQTGENAIVDWVFIEFRSTIQPAMVLYTRSALIQRDGDIVDIDGLSPITMDMLTGNYYIAIRHRNHLGVMTQQPQTIIANGFIALDFTNIETSTWGLHAQVEIENQQLMWAGNTNLDEDDIFQGERNDLDPIFFEVIQSARNPSFDVNFILSDFYSIADTDMDGDVIFQGANNDLQSAFFNILQHPLNQNRSIQFILTQQLPKL